MKVICGMATFADRKEQFRKAYKSLVSQVDELLVYDNSLHSKDLTDNGKMRFLEMFEEPVYYFTVDDDIEYSPNYVEFMIDGIEKYNAIVTLHGRRLLGKGRNYYRGHHGWKCFNQVNEEGKIDVCGTGVTAFRTDYFNPTNIYESEFKRMADLVFSLEATKQGKDIVLLAHDRGFVKDLEAPKESAIFTREIIRPLTQGKLADEIWDIKHQRNL